MTQTTWKLPNRTITLVGKDERAELNLPPFGLSRLARIWYPDIAHIASNLLFSFGHTEFTADAASAYTEKPLSELPIEVDEFVQSFDWRQEHFTSNHKAALLAGKTEYLDDIIWMLDHVNCSLLEGVVYTASSFSDRRLIERICRLAVSQDLDTWEQTGGLRAIAVTLNRWWTHETVKELDVVKRMSNYVESDDFTVNIEVFRRMMISGGF